MAVERRFLGFIGFDDCEGRGIWGAGEIDLLQAATDSFCHALERHAAEENRRQLEAQVQHAQKLESLGVMAGGIAHDFNNLLVAIMGNAGLALSEMPPDSPARDTVRDIETAAQRAAELTRQLLAYSGKGRFVVLPLDLNAIVDEMTHLFEVTVSKKAILRYDLSPGIPSVEGDATQLRQVIMNLILNASEALGDHGGTVTISTGAMVFSHGDLGRLPGGETLSHGTYAYVEVSDTGSGMPRETRDRIFEPFFTTKFTGRGLGLAAVMGIVRGHRGTIQVESAPGNGSRFRVLLPAADEPAQPVARPVPAPTTVQVNGTVLVADDEQSVRMLATKLLKRMGFEVIVAVDGAEAVRLFRERADRIGLVLLDMTMPEMGGEEVFTEIRRLCPDVKVILSSGYNEQEAIKGFAGRGLAGFLQKPYRLDELHAKVAEVLGLGGTGEPTRGS
jgi:signal transduction histidine kinase